MSISHYDLCKATAEWQLKKWHVILYEYQTVIGWEHPDVLCYKQGYTELYEIKVNKQDFKKDILKDCRIEYDVKYWCRINRVNDKIKDFIFGKPELKEFIRECPHLGRRRYYVCPKNLIQPDEVPNGWGLYWFSTGKFRKKKDSKQFKCNIYKELSLLSHAFRKYASEKNPNILINTYEER